MMILELGGIDTTTHPQNQVSGFDCILSIKAQKTFGRQINLDFILQDDHGDFYCSCNN
jgi:hypothetical protein